jgi:hypothetical protein
MSILHATPTSNPPHLRVVLPNSPSFISTYTGAQNGFSVTSNGYVVVVSLPTVPSTSYSAQFDTNMYITAGTDINKQYLQTCYYRYCTNSSGVLRVSNLAYLNVSQRDTGSGSTNGQSVQNNVTTPTMIDFLLTFNTGNTYSYTYTLLVHTCP